MAAPKGNQFWKNRSKHGRDKLFATPDLLWEAAAEYFEWCDKNPWVAVKSGTTPKGPTSEEKPTQRPYTITGLLVYIKASRSYWKDFKAAKHEDFSTIISEIENIIYTQQLEGATVGAFNANIIARKLGLESKVDITTQGKSLEKLKIFKLSDVPITNTDNE